jgi:hypothetical protein
MCRLGDTDGDVIGRNANKVTILSMETHNSIRSSSGATLLHEPRWGNLRPNRAGEFGKAREENGISNIYERLHEANRSSQ